MKDGKKTNLAQLKKITFFIFGHFYIKHNIKLYLIETMSNIIRIKL